MWQSEMTRERFFSFGRKPSAGFKVFRTHFIIISPSQIKCLNGAVLSIKQHLFVIVQWYTPTVFVRQVFSGKAAFFLDNLRDWK